MRIFVLKNKQGEELEKIIAETHSEAIYYFSDFLLDGKSKLHGYSLYHVGYTWEEIEKIYIFPVPIKLSISLEDYAFREHQRKISSFLGVR